MCSGSWGRPCGAAVPPARPFSSGGFTPRPHGAGCATRGVCLSALLASRGRARVGGGERRVCSGSWGRPCGAGCATRGVCLSALLVSGAGARLAAGTRRVCSGLGSPLRGGSPARPPFHAGVSPPRPLWTWAVPLGGGLLLSGAARVLGAGVAPAGRLARLPARSRAGVSPPRPHGAGSATRGVCLSALLVSGAGARLAAGAPRVCSELGSPLRGGCPVRPPFQAGVSPPRPLWTWAAPLGGGLLLSGAARALGVGVAPAGRPAHLPARSYAGALLRGCACQRWAPAPPRIGLPCSRCQLRSVRRCVRAFARDRPGRALRTADTASPSSGSQ